MLTGYLPASFRGVPFWVEEEEREGGRRLAIHDIAAAEAPVVEDMGRAARRWSVSAYCVGPIWSANGHALSAALDAPGPALLILPWLGPVLARVESGWRVSRSKDRHGIVEFDVTFVEAGGAAAPFGAAPAAVVIAAAILSTVAALAAGAASRGGRREGEARRRQAQAIEYLRSAVAPRGPAKLATRAEDLQASALTAETKAFIEASGALARDIAREDAAAAADLCGALAAGFAGAASLPAGLSGAIDAAADGVALVPTGSASEAVDAATAGLFLLLAAHGHASAVYETRRAAVATRDRLAALLDQVTPALDRLGSQAGESVTSAVFRAIEELSRLAASSIPTVRVETGRSLPATLLAYRLYGTPERAGLVSSSAGGAMSLMMPVAFEAPAPTVPTGGRA